MGLETLIKDIEKDFPTKDFLWVLAYNHSGRYFANIYPRPLSEISKGPENLAYGSTPNKALRAAFNNAKKNGVGRHLHGKR